MSRQARTLSKTGIYHIMLRGINQQQIFHEAEDYNKFIEIVKECKQTKDFNIYAYCLMGNHVHLLLKETEETIGQVMKRIASRFASWYNIKYQRVGHLFQDRFKSEPVEDDAYFLTVLRYIHQNPIKAGLCKKIDDYQYSSFNEFFLKSSLIDSEVVFDIISKDDFISFNNELSFEKCLEIEENPLIKVTDEQAHKLIQKYSKCKNVADFQALDIKTRDKCLKKLRDSGLSIRQISRLTGISFNIVRKF